MRPISGSLTWLPYKPNTEVDQFVEPTSEKLCWLILRRLTDIPAIGKTLLSGTRAERNKAFEYVRNFARQGRTYWSAGNRTEGSAAALLYYYGALNLAKAELMQSDPGAVTGKKLKHGVYFRTNNTDSVRSDSVVVNDGVFRLLYKKRTGMTLPLGTSMSVPNLLSLLPEIGMEMHHFGASRPGTALGYHTIATDHVRSWSLLALPVGTLGDPQEPLARLVRKHYEQVQLSDFREWKTHFAVSGRSRNDSTDLYQSKRTFAATASDSSGPEMAAFYLPGTVLGDHLSPPLNQHGEFVLTHTIKKSDPLVMPLDLVRYLVMFYLSSLVRYKPTTLDPVTQGEQSWLMDSIAKEVPLNLLSGAVMGLAGRTHYFENSGFRT